MSTRPIRPLRHFGTLAALVTTLIGCASGSKVAPASYSESTAEQRSADELLHRGQTAARRGDVTRAEQYFALAIEKGADPRRVMPLLLRACLSNSHLRTALNHAEPYLLEHPEDESLRYLVATIHLSLGQVEAARRELGLLLSQNDSHADAHYLLGIIESSGDVTEARKHFLAALERSKDREQRTELQSRLAELNLRQPPGPMAPDSIVVEDGGEGWGNTP
ncbi:MAG TPA: tetratricopeptide repeat protein [Polyangiaceae bacterium]